jgi:hypothetical protein
MGTVHTTLTMEEFLQLPELPAGKRELLRGELIELSPAKDRHNEIAHALFEALKTAASGVTGAKVRREKGYLLGRMHWLGLTSASLILSRSSVTMRKVLHSSRLKSFPRGIVPARRREDRLIPSVRGRGGLDGLSRSYVGMR